MFNGKNQGNYHYSGSSKGKNNKEKDVPITDDRIPNELKKQVGYN